MKSDVSATPPLTRTGIAIACAIVTVLFWAGSFPAITLALKAFSPLSLAALRFTLASIVLGAVMVAARMRLPWRPARRLPAPRDLAWFALCGAIGIALYNWLLNTGQQSVSPAAASFLIACQPVFSALVAVRLFGERFGPTAWVGTSVCLVGALVISFGQPGGLTFEGGAPLVLLAAVCSGSFFALQRPLTKRFGSVASALGVLACGTLWLSPWIGPGLAEIREAPPTAVAAFMYLGTLPGALAYVTWMVAIRDLGAARAANLLFFMAPLAALMSVPLTGTWPSWMTWVGGGMALAGVVVVHWAKIDC